MWDGGDSCCNHTHILLLHDTLGAIGYCYCALERCAASYPGVAPRAGDHIYIYVYVYETHMRSLIYRHRGTATDRLY